MASPVILPGRANARSTSAGRAVVFADDRARTLIGAVGLAFLVIGLFDLALAWFPSAFGSAEWEFGTVTATLNGMPVPVLGLGLLLAAVVDGDRRRALLALRVLLVALALLVAAAGILWATTLPLAFRPVDNDVMRLGLQKAVAKTALQAVAYPVLFVALAVLTRRRAA